VRNDLEESARLLVQACAMSHGFGFTPQSLRDVHDMIRDGVEEMKNKGDLSNSQKITEAQINLVNFVAKAVAEAKASHRKEIEEQTVQATRTKFCPVYPFS
jgi:hypothetical protein